MSRGRGGSVYPVPALAAHRCQYCELAAPRAHGYGCARPVSGKPSRSPRRVEGLWASRSGSLTIRQ